MASEKMAKHAKDWKSPAERADDKRAQSMKNTTKRAAKDSPDSKGPTVNAWTKSATKKPKGC